MVNMSGSSSDILIIGAGVIGMMTALQLAQSGQRVSLIDKGQAGLEASWAGGGIISPLYPWRYLPPITALATWSQSAFPSLRNMLKQTTGVDPELSAHGMLVTATDEREKALEWGAGLTQAVEEISAERAHSLEPHVQLDEIPLWMPYIASVRSPRLSCALREACLKNALIKLIEHTEVKIGGSLHDPKVTFNHQLVSFHRIVVTAGAWTGSLLSSVQAYCPIKPIKGQMLLFSSSNVANRIVLANGRYVIPRADGRIVFGSTIEDVGFRRLPDRLAFESLYASAVELIPNLARVPIEAQWAGFRPGSPTGMPWIGSFSDRLWINAGHFRNGLVLSPASARLLCDQLLGRTPIIDPAPYQPRESL